MGKLLFRVHRVRPPNDKLYFHKVVVDNPSISEAEVGLNLFVW